MGTFVVGAILLAVVCVAVIDSVSHMRGEGGCCGGGSAWAERKKLAGPVVEKKVFYIEGMHCKNCKNTVERQINRIEGASCRVNLRKKQAVVSMDRSIPQEKIIAAVEFVDFTVSRVENA